MSLHLSLGRPLERGEEAVTVYPCDTGFSPGLRSPPQSVLDMLSITAVKMGDMNESEGRDRDSVSATVEGSAEISCDKVLESLGSKDDVKLGKGLGEEEGVKSVEYRQGDQVISAGVVNSRDVSVGESLDTPGDKLFGYGTTQDMSVVAVATAATKEVREVEGKGVDEGKEEKGKLDVSPTAVDGTTIGDLCQGPVTTTVATLNSDGGERKGSGEWLWPTGEKKTVSLLSTLSTAKLEAEALEKGSAVGDEGEVKKEASTALVVLPDGGAVSVATTAMVATATAAGLMAVVGQAVATTTVTTVDGQSRREGDGCNRNGNEAVTGAETVAGPEFTQGKGAGVRGRGEVDEKEQLAGLALALTGSVQQPCQWGEPFTVVVPKHSTMEIIRAAVFAEMGARGLLSYPMNLKSCEDKCKNEVKIGVTALTPAHLRLREIGNRSAGILKDSPGGKVCGSGGGGEQSWVGRRLTAVHPTNLPRTMTVQVMEWEEHLEEEIPLTAHVVVLQWWNRSTWELSSRYEGWIRLDETVEEARARFAGQVGVDPDNLRVHRCGPHQTLRLGDLVADFDEAEGKQSVGASGVRASQYKWGNGVDKSGRVGMGACRWEDLQGKDELVSDRLWQLADGDLLLLQDVLQPALQLTPVAKASVTRALQGDRVGREGGKGGDGGGTGGDGVGNSWYSGGGAAWKTSNQTWGNNAWDNKVVGGGWGMTPATASRSHSFKPKERALRIRTKRDRLAEKAAEELSTTSVGSVSNSTPTPVAIAVPTVKTTIVNDGGPASGAGENAVTVTREGAVLEISLDEKNRQYGTPCDVEGVSSVPTLDSNVFTQRELGVTGGGGKMEEGCAPCVDRSPVDSTKDSRQRATKSEFEDLWGVSEEDCGEGGEDDCFRSPVEMMHTNKEVKEGGGLSLFDNIMP
ncbi:unnamed protein product [Choristocarpus tenellus]